MTCIPETLDGWTADTIVELLGANVYEDARFDWKQDVRPADGERFIKGAIAMANGAGGFLILGVSDVRDRRVNERLIGIERGRDVANDVAHLLKNADPAVPHRFRQPPIAVPGNPERVLPVIAIEAGMGPHSYEGTFYRREGSTSRKLTTTEVGQMFIRREESLRRLRLLVLELTIAREAALGIHLVTGARKIDFLRRIDTRLIAELHASTLPLLTADETLSETLSALRAQADVLNFRVEAIMPLFYEPRRQQPYADPNWETFIPISSPAWTLASRFQEAIRRVCALTGEPVPKLRESHEIRDGL